MMKLKFLHHIPHGPKLEKSGFQLRNPKDVVVSYYHHHKLTKSVDQDLQFSDFVKFFMKELLVEDPYMAHVKEAVALKDSPYVKFLWYEDMKKDLPAAIRDVARFVGKELTETEIAALADYLDVKNMKKNPAVNHQDRHRRYYSSFMISRLCQVLYS
jgi:hypothetical protein